MSSSIENVIFFDNDNQHKSDPTKSLCTQALSSAFDSVLLMGSPSNAYDCKKSADYIKGADLVIVWNNLKPSCLWVMDLCKRFNTPYVVVERGIVPCQGKDNFSFFAGGICFDNTNLTPSMTTENYDQNVEIIQDHYRSHNLIRPSTIQDKIVVVGQLDFDSTMTHYTDIPSWQHLINATAERFPNDHIVFCPHPRDNFTSVDCAVSNKPTVQECLDARAAILVSSTIAYELAGLNIPLGILGQGAYPFPLLRGWTKPLECQATALDYHFTSKSTPECIHKIVERLL